MTVTKITFEQINDTTLAVDDVTGTVTVAGSLSSGAISTNEIVTINQNTVAVAGMPPLPFLTCGLRLIGPVATYPTILIESYAGSNTGNYGFLVGRRARGTADFPSAVKSGDPLFAVGGNGFKASTFATDIASVVSFNAAEDWTDTATGSSIKFYTTPNTTVTTALAMTIGQDKSLTAAGSLSVGGVVTAPAQPAFFAYNSATDLNQTGLGVGAVVDFDTELFDQGSNFTSDTFTAPVAGKYRFSSMVTVVGLIKATNVYHRLIVSGGSAKNYSLGAVSGTAMAGEQSVSGSVLVSMAAGDTAKIDVTVFGEDADTADVFGASILSTWFSGELVC